MKKFLFLALISASLMAFNAAASTIQTLNIAWSGASFGNGASATGFVTLDTSLVGNLAPGITDAGITIVNAASGNGTFNFSDFSSFIFNTPSPLDFSKELIGQSLSNGSTFGDQSMSNDFNLFASTSGAPNGSWFFTLGTNNGSGDSLLVTSMSAVPVPAAVWLFASGLLGLGALRKKVQA